MQKVSNKLRYFSDLLARFIIEIEYKIVFKKLMKKDLIKMPRVKWLEYSKRAIYLDDLFTLSWYERWGRLKKQSVLE